MPEPSPVSTGSCSATSTGPATSLRPPGRTTRQGATGSSSCTPQGHPASRSSRWPSFAASTWPDTGTPQQLHLDLTVPDEASLAAQHERALGLGARLLLDRSEDPMERLYVYADPDGHPFCIFVAQG